MITLSLILIEVRQKTKFLEVLGAKSLFRDMVKNYVCNVDI